MHEIMCLKLKKKALNNNTMSFATFAEKGSGKKSPFGFCLHLTRETIITQVKYDLTRS